MDNVSETKLAKVHPLLAERIRKLVSMVEGDIRVVQGLRTYAEQDALFAQGRTKTGDKVTNARGGFSNHNFGLAVDLCPFLNAQALWHNTSTFNAIGKAVHELGGLEWGGDWKFIDRPHVQLPGLTISLCRQFFEKGGLELVWRKISELNGQPTTQIIPTASERDLKIGDKGADVRALQVKLAVGYPTVKVDGDFGIRTRDAVKAFQFENALTKDGIVGKNTREKLGL